MKLSYITLMVRDMERSVSFYRDVAELEVLRRFNIQNGEIVFLSNSLEGTMIELVRLEGAEKVSSRGMVISFQTSEDLNAVHKKAVGLGFEPSQIIDKKPKPKHFTVTDPDGIIVEFSV